MWICIMLRHEHTFKVPGYGMHSQGISFTRTVHTSPSSPNGPRRHGRLSWTGWLVTYRDKCLAPGTEPGHNHRARCRLTSLIETNVLLLHQATINNGDDKHFSLYSSFQIPPLQHVF